MATHFLPVLYIGTLVSTRCMFGQVLLGVASLRQLKFIVISTPLLEEKPLSQVQTTMV